MQYVTQKTLESVLDRITGNSGIEGDLYLIGETSLVWEGHRDWTDEVEIAAVAAGDSQDSVERLIGEVSADTGIAIENEFPGDVIPLPDDWPERCRRIVGGPGLRLSHFDPYSVSFRFLARGDEEDYRLVLSYLRHGWVTLEEMEDHLARLLPRFSFETISQDPAEFRRRFKGLQQMARARDRR